MIKTVAEKKLKPQLNRLGRALARLPLTANAWTVCGLLCGLGSGFAIAGRAFWPAAALLAMVLVCDTADGLVARASGRASPFGGLLDVASDKYVEGAIFVGAGCIAPPLLGIPGVVWAALGLWGSIIVSLVSNVGIARLGRPAFKLADRTVRGVIGIVVLLLVPLAGEVAITAGMVAIGALSHATVALMLLDYSRGPAP
ncbi:MAG TPA: CDP-alcohol phosphatidyltransferase family protein, partial [Planctomycetota bacterium]|nr:CDP-alcohol phosphatidyltransferase family protein [Planctomycetota bacterium]